MTDIEATARPGVQRGRAPAAVTEAHLPLMIIPALATGGVAVWSPSVLTLDLAAICSAIPLLYFYLASKTPYWDIAQIFAIVAVIFVPVSVALGMEFNHFGPSQGLALAQFSLTVMSLAVLVVLNAGNRPAAQPIKISETVDPLPVLTLAGAALLFSFVIPIPVAGERLLFAAAVLSAAAGAGAGGLFRGIRLHYIGLSAVLALLYYNTVFTGFGRLLIASLGFAILIGMTGLRSSTLIRGASIAAIIPLLMVASFIETTRSSENQDVSLGLAGFSEGLGSVFGPIGTFGDAMDRDMAAGKRIVFNPERSTTRGTTIAAAVVSPIPRIVWEDKPEGLGRVGVEEFYPQLRASSDHTLAFMMFGEFYYEFGLVGIVVGGVVLLWAIRRVELGRGRLVAAGSTWSRVRVAAYAILLSGIPDFMWGGLFGVASRAMLRLLFLVAVAGLTAWFSQYFGRRSGSVGVGGR